MLPSSFWPPIASLVYSLISPLPIAGLYEVFSILHPPACTLFICLILYLSGHSTLNPGSCQAVLCSSDICHIFFFKKGFTILFTCFWLCGVSTAAWLFSSCAGATRAAVRGFLLAEASPVTDHGLQCLWLPGSGTQAQYLRRFTAWGIFPDRGLYPCLLPCQADALPLSHQGNP